jgi:hypothetical protein
MQSSSGLNNDSFQELSWADKLLRCYYRAVEMLLDRSLVEYVLIDSYRQFIEAGEPYPFVLPGEVKPGGVGQVGEYANHNTALAILLEKDLIPELKTNIRARRPQEAVQRNLQRYLFGRGLPQDKITVIRDLETRSAIDSLRPLYSLDYGLLIQQRSSGTKARLNYSLTHFHVMIDEVLDRVIEAFGLRLRYLSKNLFEQGEEYASLLEEKFYELYGMKSTAAGRRTAAVVAHNLLIRNPGLHAVYVGSTEARSLIKITKNDHVTRWMLVALEDEMIEKVTRTHGVSRDYLTERFFLPETNEAVGVLSVEYQPTTPGMPPPDRKARKEIKIPERWVSVQRQLLLPQPSASDTGPLQVSWVYKGTKS